MTKNKAPQPTTYAQTNHSKHGYASVNGLKMYYEVRGTGEPLVMLHGGMSTIGAFSQVLPTLARHRQIIAVEQQGHGHTADIDRPFSFEQMAVDTATLQPEVLLLKLTAFLDAPICRRRSDYPRQNDFKLINHTKGE